MKNSEVAKVFQDIADLLELKGENQFKIRAYQKAVRSIEHLPVEVERLVAEDRLREVPGVNTSSTPASLRTGMSSSGTMPPPNTGMSPAPFSFNNSISLVKR